jgi:choline kinase
MNALILCAGSARRFFPQDDNGARHPKCLLPLQGHETILSRLLRQTVARGYSAVLGTGCGHEQVAQLIHERATEFPNVHCIFNADYATTNSIVTLWQMRDFVTDETLLINGDVVVDDAVFDLLDLHLNAPQLLVKHLSPFDDDTYRVRFDETFRVLEMGKDISAQPSPHCAAFLGVSRVGNAALFLREIENLLSSGTKQTWPTTAYRQMLNELPARAVPIGDVLFFDIDTPEEYDAARAAVTVAESAHSVSL